MVIRHFNVGETLRKNSKERHCGRDRTDRSARRLRNAYGPAAKEDIDKWDPLARENFLNATKMATILHVYACVVLNVSSF